MPERGTLDVSKAKKLLDYSPQFNLEKGLHQIYQMVQKFLEKSLK